jgi:hypothetical protein
MSLDKPRLENNCKGAQMNSITDSILNKFEYDLESRPEPYRRIFIRDLGFAVNTSGTPKMVINAINHYNRKLGSGRNKDIDIRIRRVYNESKDIAMNAVLKVRTKG